VLTATWRAWDPAFLCAPIIMRDALTIAEFRAFVARDVVVLGPMHT